MEESEKEFKKGLLKALDIIKQAIINHPTTGSNSEDGIHTHPERLNEIIARIAEELRG